MSTNTILELRQADATSVYANGDYEVQLTQDITLNSGDVWSLKNAMIDTRLETNVIVLEDDITIQTASCPFFNDLQDFSASIATNKFVDGTPSDYKQTMLDYCPMKYIDTGAIPNLIQINSWNYTIYTTNATAGPGKISKYATTYEYLNEYGQVSYTHGSVSFIKTPNGPVSKVDTFPTVIGQAGSFSVKQNNIPNDWGVNFSLNPNTAPVEGIVYKPYSMTNQFVLKKGVYSADEIAQLITEAMTTNFGGSAFSMVQSPYLWKAESFEVGYDQPDGSPGKIEQPVIFCDPSLSYALTFKTGIKQWIGTSQIAVEFDSVSQRYSFVFNHFPCYDSTGKNICVKYGRFNQDTTKPIQGIAHYGGIFFQSLTATDSNGNYYNFWGKLGFDVSQIISNQQLVGTLESNRFGLTGAFYEYYLGIGQTNTSGFFGLDSCVVKDVGTNGNWFEESSFAAGSSVLYSTINTTVPLRAALTLPQLQNQFSHYVLSCDLYFTQMIGGVNSYKNFHGVITKYYSFASFCYGDTGGAFEYIHSGAPVVIKSVRVRLLTPSKQPDPLLGVDNSLYFQVIRNTPNLVKSIN